MYLTNLFIENMGSIEKLQILEKDLFLENGNPKPIILLGKNGSGKTTMLSSITDSLLELANDSFKDILPLNGLGHPYYKISGGGNKTLGKNYGFCFIQYKSGKKPYEYIDKNGDISYKDCIEKTNNLLTIHKNRENKNNFKASTETEKDKNFEDDLKSNSYCVFPYDRFEFPHRLNRKTDKILSDFQEHTKYDGKLNKPILIKSSLDSVKSWILDLFLDSRTGLIRSEDGKTYNTTQNPQLVEYFQQGVDNIEGLLSSILGKDIGIDTNFRGQGLSRIKIIDKITHKDIIPSLDNLSAGESILLGMFGTIIKYSDLADLNKSINLKEIKGIVVIDEIDLHLHIRLQKEVLPKLISSFPKVQFIISTHSPFFLYGMNEEYLDNCLMLNMPSGFPISYNNFEEFNEAYEIFQDLTNDYKIENEKLKKEIEQQNKPIVFVEGPTDVEYITKAYELFNKEMSFDLRIIGTDDRGGTKSSNNDALKNAEAFLKNNKELVKQKIILLNDPEENRQEGDFGNLFVRKMKKFENYLQHGIENLFDNDFIEKVMENNLDCFEYHVVGDKKINHKIVNGEKQTVCNRICKNGTKKDFKNFNTIIDSIQKIIETPI